MKVPLWRRQLPILLIVPSALLVAMAASLYAREALLPLVWAAPFYVNPVIWVLYLFYVGTGLLLVTGTQDRGWVVYLTFVLVAVFALAFLELSLISWLEIQAQARLERLPFNPILIVALAVAVGATVLLHVNQLSRRLSDALRARGLDEAEIEILEVESRREGQRHVSLLVGFVGMASLVLWVGDFIVGGLDLGLNILAIMFGLLIVSVFLMMVYRLLQRGPLDLDAATGGVVSAHELARSRTPAARHSAQAPKSPDEAPNEWRRV